MIRGCSPRRLRPLQFQPPRDGTRVRAPPHMITGIILGELAGAVCGSDIIRLSGIDLAYSSRRMRLKGQARQVFGPIAVMGLSLLSPSVRCAKFFTSRADKKML